MSEHRRNTRKRAHHAIAVNDAIGGHQIGYVGNLSVDGMLLISSQRGSDWARPQRAKLYRLVEFIGYWSMLDVFVVALLTALVRFSVLSRVEPLPGVIFFGLTVVLTMLASISFDPRLIWDGRNTDD